MMANCLATRAELHPLSLLMYASFFEDPAWCYVLPTVRLRSQWLYRLMRAALEVSLENGLVWMQADERSGAPVAVAIWYPAGKPFPPRWYRALAPALRILDFSLFHFACAWRYKYLEKQMLRLRPTSVTRCWYLAGLAVAHKHRGAGIGSRLVEEGLLRAAANQAPAFLQAWDHKLPFYERLGFVSVSQFSLPNGSSSCHGMLWQPPALPESIDTSATR